MEFLYTVWEKLQTSISRWVFNNVILDEEMEVLIKKVEDLVNLEKDMNLALDNLERQHGKKGKEEVNIWLEKVERTKNKVGEREQQVRESRYLPQWWLQWLVRNDIREVSELFERGKFREGLLIGDEDEYRGEVQEYSREVPEDIQSEHSEGNISPGYYWTENQSEEDSCRSDPEEIDLNNLDSSEKGVLIEESLAKVREDTDDLVELPNLDVFEGHVNKGEEIVNLEPDIEEYDVFVSFRGPDTRYNLTRHLCYALRQAKIKVFDDICLQRGEEISQTFNRAIEGSKISVIVFSKNYALSTFCLDQLVKIIECRESKEHIVLPIFYRVDPFDVGKLCGFFGDNFERLKSRSSDEQMQRWKLALRKAAELSGFHIGHASEAASCVRGIVEVVSNRLHRGLTRQSKREELISKPLDGLNTVVAQLEKIWQCLMNDDTSRIGIWGIGGVGKTTIVAHIYNRLITDVNSFQHVLWVTVSQESSIYKLQSDIAEEINLDLSREENERTRAARLWTALKKKKFVLILDDVWESFQIEEVGIPTLADGRKLLLTTRELRVCKRMMCERIVEVEPLTKREAEDLFISESGHEIGDNPNLRQFVKSIVGECDGLPLGNVAIARSTREFSKISEWRNILKELHKPTDRQ